MIEILKNTIWNNLKNGKIEGKPSIFLIEFEHWIPCCYPYLTTS